MMHCYFGLIFQLLSAASAANYHATTGFQSFAPSSRHLHRKLSLNQRRISSHYLSPCSSLYRTTAIEFSKQTPEESTNYELSKEEKLKSFQKDIQEKFKEERSYNTFGILSPIAKTLDEVSGDWALSYADLRPATPRTIEGQAFLATNVGYAAAGLILGVQGDWFFAFLTELAGIVSFWYHYSQLEFGQNREEVRLALLTDYFTAGAALITGGFYMAEMGISGVPLDALITGAAAVVCLSLCWVWEFGYPYLFWHSLWHILSAYTGFLVGQAHIGIR